MTSRGFLVAVSALVMLTACGGDEEVETINNRGRWCIYSEEPTWESPTSQQFEPGDTLWVTVNSPCLSGSCDALLQASCTIIASGTHLTVSSTFEIEHSGASACTDDCGIERATCSLLGLAGGSFSISHGGESRSMDVPGTVDPNCAGTGP